MRSISVTIIIRKLTGIANTPQAEVPTKVLQEYFRTANIGLTFLEGDYLHYDPTNDIREVNFLRNHLAPSSADNLPWPALLVIGSLSKDGKGTNGMLADAKQRGIAAVYTSATNFLGGDDDSRFQIFVHEIGHLLNLCHGDANEDYPTAMNQWPQRVVGESAKEVWGQAIADADVCFQEKMERYCNISGMRYLGLPLSSFSRNYLGRDAHEDDIQPWGSEFRDVNLEGIYDKNVQNLSIRVSLEGEELTVNGPLDFTITVRASLKKTELVLVPESIGFKFGTLVLRIQRPDEIEYTYLPQSIVCAPATRLLSPGESIKRNFSILKGRNGFLFPLPGKYTLKFFIPLLSISSEITINVNPASSQIVLLNNSFQNFLAKDLPQNNSRQWERMDSLIAGSEISTQMRNHLAELRVSQRPNSKKNQALLDLVKRSSVTKRVKERVLLNACIRLYHSKSKKVSLFRQLIEETIECFGVTDQRHPSIEFLNHIDREKTKGEK